MMYKGYEIVNERGHVIIMKDGKFVSTADTISEAEYAIDEIEEDSKKNKKIYASV